jgi:tetrahydromethanopterin S-methyltransferase subunit F
VTNPTDEWNDLTRMWQADAAGVSVADIDAHLQRQRRQMLGVTIAEMLGLGAGVFAAVLVILFAHLWMGVVIILFGGISAWITVRMRREGAPPGSSDLMKSLKESIEREDWLAGQLRLGRALSFVALFAIVQATSVQLFRLQAFSATALTATGIGSAVVLAALAWNLVLTGRSRRRLARLKYLDERLKA